MAYLNEVAEWVPGIYQLEEDDPVLGGENGIDNVQAIQLASRTAWLRAQVAALGSLQREVIEASGLDPDAPSVTILNRALQRLFAGNMKVLTHVGSPHTLAADDAGLVQINAAGGNVVVNLPAASALAGLTYRLRRVDTAAGNTVTINRSGANTIDEGATSITLSSKATRSIQSDGETAWVSVSGGGFATAAEAQGLLLPDKPLSSLGLEEAFKGSNQLLAPSGRQRLPGGLLLQWRPVTITAGTTLIATFPIAFPNAVLAFAAIGVQSGDTATSFVSAKSGTALTTSLGLTVSSLTVATTLFAVGY